MSDGKRSPRAAAAAVAPRRGAVRRPGAIDAARPAPGVYMGEPDYKQATPAPTRSTPDHAAVIARVSHLGYSYSIFRFDRPSATLVWDPANTAAGSLSAKVETASITSSVKGFGEQLAGDEFLKSKAFPEATSSRPRSVKPARAAARSTASSA